MIDFLFEKVIYLYFSWWSLWKYVQKQHIESTDTAWVSDVTFSKNNESNGLNLKTMEMTDDDHIVFWHSDLSKYTNDARNGLCVQ